MKISPSKKGIPTYPVLMKTLGLAAAAVSLVSCDKAERKRQLGGLVENQQVTSQQSQRTGGVVLLEEEPLQLGGDVPYVPEDNETQTLPELPSLPESEDLREPQCTLGVVAPAPTDEHTIQQGDDGSNVPEESKTEPSPTPEYLREPQCTLGVVAPVQTDEFQPDGDIPFTSENNVDAE